MSLGTGSSFSAAGQSIVGDGKRIKQKVRYGKFDSFSKKHLDIPFHHFLESSFRAEVEYCGLELIRGDLYSAQDGFQMTYPDSVTKSLEASKPAKIEKSYKLDICSAHQDDHFDARNSWIQ